MAQATCYEILGVPQDTTSQMVILAFQKLAPLCHPDFNGYDQTTLPIKHVPISQKEYWNLICKACDVLMNVHHRVFYHIGKLNEVYNFDGDCMKIYQKFRHQPDADLKALETNPTLETILEVALEDLFFGKEQQVEYLRVIDANGSYQMTKQVMKIMIDPYMRHNGSFIMPGYGHLQSDLKVIIHLKMHDDFTTHGDDLMWSTTVPLYTALVGAPLDIKTIDKKPLKMYVRPFVSTLHTLQRRFTGEGLKTPTGRGDLIVNISVTLDNMSKDMRKKLAGVMKRNQK